MWSHLIFDPITLIVDGFISLLCKGNILFSAHYDRISLKVTNLQSFCPHNFWMLHLSTLEPKVVFVVFFVVTFESSFISYMSKVLV